MMEMQNMLEVRQHMMDMQTNAGECRKQCMNIQECWTLQNTKQMLGPTKLEMQNIGEVGLT